MWLFFPPIFFQDKNACYFSETGPRPRDGCQLGKLTLDGSIRTRNLHFRMPLLQPLGHPRFSLSFSHYSRWKSMKCVPFNHPPWPYNSHRLPETQITTHCLATPPCMTSRTDPTWTISSYSMSQLFTGHAANGLPLNPTFTSFIPVRFPFSISVSFPLAGIDSHDDPVHRPITE